MAPVHWNWFILTSVTFPFHPTTNDGMLSLLLMISPLLPPFTLFPLNWTLSRCFRSFRSGLNIYCLADSCDYVRIVGESLGQMSFLPSCTRRALSSSFLHLTLLSRMDMLRGLIVLWWRRQKLCVMLLAYLQTCGSLH